MSLCSSLTGEYWLGNDRISQLTKTGPTEVLVEMQDWTGAKASLHRSPSTGSNQSCSLHLFGTRFQCRHLVCKIC